THLPRFNELAPVFANEGVDKIYCLSVNDAFVMDAWAADQGAGHIAFLADGNGEFSKGMGMLVDKTANGMGERSWRYSMLVKDGIIEKMFIEPDKPGDPFEVSDADTMLNYINPEASKPSAITVFSKPGCPFCAKAKQMLLDNNLRYEEVMLGKGISSITLKAVSGQSTVPQVFIDGRHIGGSEALADYLSK